MSDLALGADGDLLVQGGDLVIVTGPEAVGQDWALRLGMMRGEWSLDRRVGTDWRSLLDGSHKPTDPLVRFVIDKITRETPGILSVTHIEYAFDRGSRTLTASADVVYDSGGSTLTYENVLFPDNLASEVPA